MFGVAAWRGRSTTRASSLRPAAAVFQCELQNGAAPSGLKVHPPGAFCLKVRWPP